MRDRRERCVTGKVQHATFADALAQLDSLSSRDLLRGPVGSVYTCQACGAWHVSSKMFTLVKPKGRGKRRRGLVDSAG